MLIEQVLLPERHLTLATVLFCLVSQLTLLADGATIVASRTCTYEVASEVTLLRKHLKKGFWTFTLSLLSRHIDIWTWPTASYQHLPCYT